MGVWCVRSATSHSICVSDTSQTRGHLLPQKPKSDCLLIHTNHDGVSVIIIRLAESYGVYVLYVVYVSGTLIRRRAACWARQPTVSIV